MHALGKVSGGSLVAELSCKIWMLLTKSKKAASSCKGLFRPGEETFKTFQTDRDLVSVERSIPCEQGMKMK